MDLISMFDFPIFFIKGTKRRKVWNNHNNNQCRFLSFSGLDGASKKKKNWLDDDVVVGLNCEVRSFPALLCFVLSCWDYCAGQP